MNAQENNSFIGLNNNDLTPIQKNKHQEQISNDQSEIIQTLANISGKGVNSQVIKYNLSPDYQYVKASFRDTTKAVTKLREGAEELRQKYRFEKNIKDTNRLTQWGVQPTQGKKKKKKQGRRPEDVISEDMIISPKRVEKIKKSEAVLDRLLADTEVRRIQKERL